MENLLNDLRYALRNLAKSPGFTVVAILTLALGIGANTAIFTVAKQVLLDPMPYPDPERVMVIMESNPEAGLPRFSVSPPNYVDFRDQNQSFESTAALTGGTFNLTSNDGRRPERLRALMVTGGFFDVYGIQPQTGRTIVDDDDRPDAAKVVILNHGFWQRRFGGAPDIVDQVLQLDGEGYTVIGVLPAAILESVDVVAPLALDYSEIGRGAHFLGMRGRLKPEVTQAQAHTELKAIAARLEAEYPDSNTGWTTIVMPLKDLMVEDFRGIVWLLLAAVGLVLVVACVNVANLQLVRMAAREREVAVRAALGAGRWRLVRQFLTESTLLALAGGALGALLAWRGTGALVALAGDDVPRAEEIVADGGVLLFAFGLSLLTGFVFGSLPAFQASRPDLQGTLKEGGRGQAGGVHGSTVRSILVATEVAVAVVLLVGAGLLIRSLQRLVDVDPGFEPRGALTAQLELPGARYAEDQDRALFYRRLFDDLGALPGVEEAGGVVPMPLTGSGFILTFYVEGTPMPEPNKFPNANIRVINEDYFEAMKIPLLSGRGIERRDGFDAPWVVVINESTATKFFPGQNPLDQRITFDDPEDEDARWMTVVGVVGDVHHEELSEATDPEIYWSYQQRPRSSTTLVLRTGADPGALAGPLREALQRIDPELPVYRVRTLEEIVDASVAQPRFNSLLWGVFAGLALLLASIGVYGVVSYSVAQGRRDIGVRLALGAGRSGILAMVLKGGLVLIGAGLAVGLLIAVFASKLLERMIFEVSTTDVATFAAVVVVLAVVGTLACLLPAWRATRVDPVVALRDE